MVYVGALKFRTFEAKVLLCDKYRRKSLVQIPIQQVALTEQLAVIVRPQKLHWRGQPSVNHNPCDFVTSFSVIRVNYWLLSLEVHLQWGLIIFTSSIIRFYASVVQFQCNTVRAVEGLVDMRPLRALLGIAGDSGAVCSYICYLEARLILRLARVTSGSKDCCCIHGWALTYSIVGLWSPLYAKNFRIRSLKSALRFLWLVFWKYFSVWLVLSKL